MKVAVIGGGLTGLTAAYKLLKEGHEVTIYEKGNSLGGLAAGFKEKKWGWCLEFFYHHLFTSDLAVKNLLKELGLTQKIYSASPKTSIFFKCQIAQFDSPLSLLKFPHLSFVSKIQTGFATLYLRLRSKSGWKTLEKMTAHHYLPQIYGQEAYQILWEPLLKGKFKDQYESIPASWFWARIKKRSATLIYPQGGFQTIIDSLNKNIKNMGGKIQFNYAITNLQSFLETENPDKTIFTTPTSIFLQTASTLPSAYIAKVSKLEMLGAVNLIFILKQQFLENGTYWLNINEQNFPFVAVVEHTNFVDIKYYDDNHILYVGGYYPQDHKYFKMTKEQILQEFMPYLQRINPNFNFHPLAGGSNLKLARSLYTQPIVPLNYSQTILPHKTPIQNVYLANMEQVYPWDRGTNYAIELGNKIANEILQ